MLNVLDFICENIYIVTVVLFIIGIMLKNTPKIPNWSIPYILSLISIILCILILGFKLNSILQGIINAGVAVYSYELFKQGKELPFFNKNKNE